MADRMIKVRLTWIRVAFTIQGNPAPKKNSGRIVFVGAKCRGCNRGRYPKIMPADAWKRWADEAKETFPLWRPVRSLPLDGIFNVRAVFYRKDAREVDAVNLYEGLADILELCGIVANDRQLVTWNGTEPPRIDRENPRTEVVLEEVRDIARMEAVSEELHQFLKSYWRKSHETSS